MLPGQLLRRGTDSYGGQAGAAIVIRLHTCAFGITNIANLYTAGALNSAPFRFSRAT